MPRINAPSIVEFEDIVDDWRSIQYILSKSENTKLGPMTVLTLGNPEPAEKRKNTNSIKTKHCPSAKNDS